MQSPNIVFVSLIILAVKFSVIECAALRSKRDVIEQYGLKIDGISQPLKTHHQQHRLRRHRRHPKPEPAKNARICYFSPIQCLFTRPV
ncbi:hypothetical protein AAVH_09527 [Aphelenchoides avenae]|nr:hypothetical protein AAVH_09527 [Aphelenchus avenae]